MEIRAIVFTSLAMCIAVGFTQQADANECDEQRGEKVYTKCAACHPLEEGVHTAGPSLFKLFGRQAGKVKGFPFSYAFESSDLIWNAETLSAFLENPMGYIPGSVMPFAGLKNTEDRDALVCWMAGR